MEKRQVLYSFNLLSIKIKIILILFIVILNALLPLFLLHLLLIIITMIINSGRIVKTVIAMLQKQVFDISNN